jgi:hypothetical protein
MASLAPNFRSSFGRSIILIMRTGDRLGSDPAVVVVWNRGQEEHI